MKKGTIVSIAGVLIAVIALATLFAKNMVTIVIVAAGVAIYLLGKKLNQAKK